MAISFQVTRFAKSTGANGTTQDVTLNFTPKAILVFSEGNTANNTVSAEYNFSWGFSDGTNHAAMAAAGDDGATVSETGRILRNDAVYVKLNNSTPRTTTDCYGSVAFATNKVTFTWTLNDAVASLITVVAFGGDDITNVKVNTVNAGGTNTAPENIDYTGLGFTPTDGNAILFLMTVGLAVNNTNSTTALPFFGTAVSSSKRWAVSNIPENNVDPTDTWRLHTSSRCLRGIGIDGALSAPDYDFVSWISDGFRLSSNTAIATNIQQSYMVIKGGTWDCGSLQSPTSPTNNVDYTASVSSKQLRGLIFAGTATSSDGTSTSESVLTAGATDGTNHSCIGTITEDAATTQDDYRVNDTTNVIRPLSTNGAALDVATFNSFSTNNFRLDWGTADGTARYYGWVAVADQTSFQQYQRSINETSVSVSETLARIPKYLKPISNETAISVSETLARIATYLKPISNESSVSVSETLERIPTYVKSISDNAITGSESLTKILKYVKTINDPSISVSETLIRIQSLIKIINETAVTVSETLGRIQLKIKPINETSIIVSEQLIKGLVYTRPINESAINVNQTLIRLPLYIRPISETSITINDSIARWISISYTLAEPSISVNDEIAGALFYLRSISNETAITTDDSISTLLAAVRTITDEPSISVSDTITRIQTILKTIEEDPISVDQTLQGSLLFTALLVESRIKWYYSLLTRKIGA